MVVAGIKNQFESRLRARDNGWRPATTTAKRGTVALLCGAGGTAKAGAYCFEQMGCSHVIIMNRTLSRAEALASEFGDGFVATAPDGCAALLEKLGRLDYIVCTLPGSTGYVLPDDVLVSLRDATRIRPCF